MAKFYQSVCQSCCWNGLRICSNGLTPLTVMPVCGKNKKTMKNTFFFFFKTKICSNDDPFISRKPWPVGLLFMANWWKLSQNYIYHKIFLLNPCPVEPGHLLSLDILWPCIQYRSRSVGFWRSQLNLHCLPLSMQIYSNNLDQVIRLAEN